MTRKLFRLMCALLGAGPRGARAASRFAPGGLAWLTPLLLGPACALALDIGEIQVHSSLNQLFDARIPLPTLAPEELSKVSVKLAPAPMFKEFNLERAPVLTNLVFSVEYNTEGQVYVKVVSTKPIQEPSLGLLVEFGWPRGKTFREFTVFLDPVKRLAQRPGDRSKTVLNAPATAPAPPVEPAPIPPTATATPLAQSVPPAEVAVPPAQPAPPPVAAAPPARPVPPTVVAAVSEPGEPDAPAGDRLNPEVVAAAETESVEASGKPPLPVEAPPATVRVYRPGDTYGPVAEGEGLWGIALKVRPDPDITRDQMMQALFQANPHAFSKAGVSGLKTGAMLRIPSFREIADITGSAAARQLAGVEQQSVVAAAPPPSPAALATESPTSKVVASAPEVFPLEPPAPLEPTVVVASPPAPEPVAPAAEPAETKPEPAQPEPESLAATPESVAPAAEPAEAKPEPAQPEPEAVAAAPESVAPVSEPAVADLEPMIAESAETPVAVPAEPVQEVMLEPVSVTPLLFLAVSEMIATLAQPPAMTTVSEVEALTLEPKREASAPSESSVVVSEIETPEPALTATPEPPVAPRNAIALLTAVEKYSPPLEQPDWLLQTVLASDITVPILAASTESLPAPTMPAGTVVASSAARVEVPAPAVSGSPQQLAAGPGEASAKAAEPSPHPYKGGDQYGPVAPKERLWDIAAKVRPDPGISKEHMMKTLFKANPQAFSKPNNMDSLKVGATLRIPTLQEIVEYTGSRAARQLLEQQQTAAIPPAPAPEPVAPAVPVTGTLPTPEPAAPTAETSPPALEPAAPAAETPAAPEPVVPLVPTTEMPPSSEPSTPELVAPPVSEPPAPESSTPAVETPAALELTPPSEPTAETPPVPTPEPTTPPAPEPIAPAAEAPPAGETPSAN